MTSELMQNMRAAFVAERNAPNEPLSLAQRRARFEEGCSKLPVPSEISVETLSLSGVTCEVITPKRTGGELMLYIHGGGFCVGSPRSHRGLVARIACAAEMIAIVPEYRLAPEHPFPAASDDILSVYRAIIAEWDAAPRSIAGDSAGGCLALTALFDVRDYGLPLPPGACALISPCTDLTMSGSSILERKDIDPFLAPDRLRDMFNAYSSGADLTDPRISPLFGDFTGLPPVLVEVGTDEILFDDAVRLTEKLRGAGVDTTLHVADGLFHVYHAFAPAPEAVEGAERIGAFLKPNRIAS